MSIRIGSNISSLTAQRRLAEADATLQRGIERLSTGLRINRASDDAAGLAISSTLNSKSRVYTQAIRNLNDGVSYFSVAEGGIKELKEILFRQRELSTQSSNGTYGDQQRLALERELGQLQNEYNRILDSTTFNDRSVFSAKESALVLQCGYGVEGTLSGDFGAASVELIDPGTQRVNTTSSGAQSVGDAVYYESSVSNDGRYVAFSSEASDLVANDTNNARDVFVKDLLTGETKMVSVSSAGVQGNLYSDHASISADGRYVAFYSAADNLILNETGSARDVFIHDLLTGETKKASISSSGVFGLSHSEEPTISANGRFVIFRSAASNLVSGDTGETDVFIHDMLTGETKRCSVSSSGTQADDDSNVGDISADGRYVVFESLATNLVVGDNNGQRDIFWHDTLTGETKLVSSDKDGDMPQIKCYRK